MPVRLSWVSLLHNIGSLEKDFGKARLSGGRAYHRRRLATATRGIRTNATIPMTSGDDGSADETAGVAGGDACRAGEAAGGAGDDGQHGDTESGADLVSGHQEAAGQSGVLRRDAGHGADRDRDEHHSDAEAEQHQAGKQIGGVVGVTRGDVTAAGPRPR